MNMKGASIMMAIKRSLCSAIVVLLTTATANNAIAQNTPPQVSNSTMQELQNSLTDSHPSAYFELASRLFAQGSEAQKQAAVRWFYIGQIRYRAYLKANPDFEPSADPALFSSLMEVVGRPLNGYIGADVDAWVTIIDQAITWHQQHPDNFMGKQQHQATYNEVVDGLQSMRDDLAASKAQIEQQREANGLENRHIEIQ
ncbi:hypothetical protein [Idiomarina xiamenensis]|nr:hypothetical protein [Idiomarina xiamenensis]